MQENLEILSRAIERIKQNDRPVAQTPSAQKLEEFLDLELGERKGTREELETAINQFLDFSPNSSHSEFYKLLYSGRNDEALLGDWITALTNNTMHTYQVGPVATLMELELIRSWNNLVGFENGDGVMVSGGSQANMMGMMLARHHAGGDYKRKGFIGSENARALVAYVSDQAHYSNQRSANVLGIGTDNLVSVASDDEGRIDPNALRAAIQRDLDDGRQPFYIGLTAGTTVIGAYDDVAACSEIAREHDIWLHIDGAWGAPVLFSNDHKHLLANSHLADSFAWDAHKLMNVPVTAAVVLVKRRGALQQAVAGGGGDYLFHEDDNSQYNLGERSIQCGRRADSLKVWLSWKAQGNIGFADKIDQLQILKAQCVKGIEQRACLEMLAPAVYLNVLFRYAPQSEISEQEIGEFNIKLCQRMRDEGGPYVDFARYKGRTGIRLILANELTRSSNIEELLDHCERIGSELELEQKPLTG